MCQSRDTDLTPGKSVKFGGEAVAAKSFASAAVRTVAVQSRPDALR